MKPLSPSNPGRFIAVIIVLFCLNSCNTARYFILGKKYTYYADYSDTKKKNYYSDNKVIIDSLVVLSSSHVFPHYIEFKKTVLKEPLPISVIPVNPRFFDTTTSYQKNVAWMKYQQSHPSEAEEFKIVMNRMIGLVSQLHRLSKNQYKEADAIVRNNSVYLPLKKIAEDIYAGGIIYSYLIVFDPEKTNADSVRSNFYRPETLHLIENNLFTNKLKKEK